MIQNIPNTDATYVEEKKYEYWYEYDRVRLSELVDGVEYTGRPILKPVETVNYNYDGENQTKYRCQLLLINDEMEEYLQININLKSPENIQENIHHMSGLFKLIGSLNVCLKDKDWLSKYNRILQLNLDDWTRFIDGLETMTIRVNEEVGNSFTYNSFTVIDAR